MSKEFCTFLGVKDNFFCESNLSSEDYDFLIIRDHWVSDFSIIEDVCHYNVYPLIYDTLRAFTGGNSLKFKIEAFKILSTFPTCISWNLYTQFIQILQRDVKTKYPEVEVDYLNCLPSTVYSVVLVIDYINKIYPSDSELLGLSDLRSFDEMNTQQTLFHELIDGLRLCAETYKDAVYDNLNKESFLQFLEKVPNTIKRCRIYYETIFCVCTRLKIDRFKSYALSNYLKHTPPQSKTFFNSLISKNAKANNVFKQFCKLPPYLKFSYIEQLQLSYDNEHWEVLTLYLLYQLSTKSHTIDAKTCKWLKLQDDKNNCPYLKITLAYLLTSLSKDEQYEDSSDRKSHDNKFIKLYQKLISFCEKSNSFYGILSSAPIPLVPFKNWVLNLYVEALNVALNIWDLTLLYLTTSLIVYHEPLPKNFKLTWEAYTTIWLEMLPDFVCERSLEIAPFSLLPTEYCGFLDVSKEFYNSAKSTFKKLLEYRPKARCYIMLAFLMLTETEENLSEEFQRDSRILANDSKDLFLNLAENQGRYVQAKEALEKARFALCESNSVIEYCYCLCLHKLQCYKEAIIILNSLISKYPLDIEFRFLRILCQVYLKTSLSGIIADIQTCQELVEFESKCISKHIFNYQIINISYLWIDFQNLQKYFNRLKTIDLFLENLSHEAEKMIFKGQGNDLDQIIHTVVSEPNTRISQFLFSCDFPWKHFLKGDKALSDGYQFSFNSEYLNTLLSQHYEKCT